MSGKDIVWREGMFIAPHHFQQANIEIRNYINEVAQLELCSGDYGLSELTIKEDFLKVGKFGVSFAAGVFPDRTFFRSTTELVLDIPDGTVEAIVFLGVPLALNGTKQVGDVLGVHRMLARQTMLQDISDPENEPLDAEVSRLGVTLLLQSTDTANMSLLPIARILEKTTDGRIILDQSYIAPCISVCSSDVVCDRLDEILALTRARCSNAASRVSASQSKQAPDTLFQERLEVLQLNRFILFIQGTVAHPRISGRSLYNMLAEMLVTIDPTDVTPTDPELIYNPKEPSTCFNQLFAKLRTKLTLEAKASVIALEWNSELFEKRRLLRLAIPLKLLDESRRTILAIFGPDSTSFLAENIPLASKLAGLSTIPDLVRRGLPGIELSSMPNAPIELRDRTDAAFFLVNTDCELWHSFIDKQEALALHVDDRIQSFEAILYMLD